MSATRARRRFIIGLLAFCSVILLAHSAEAWKPRWLANLQRQLRLRQTCTEHACTLTVPAPRSSAKVICRRISDVFVSKGIEARAVVTAKSYDLLAVDVFAPRYSDVMDLMTERYKARTAATEVIKNAGYKLLTCETHFGNL